MPVATTIHAVRSVFIINGGFRRMVFHDTPRKRNPRVEKSGDFGGQDIGPPLWTHRRSKCLDFRVITHNNSCPVLGTFVMLKSHILSE
ncbi:hypothetical protein TNCV_2192911 [Trichonephila clavipes]|nr:hypothetical protein TNCV_2192911 [Trichonephila clavipes]